jgi:hypothetical protein
MRSTSCAMAAQLCACQMPYSFSRMAAAPGRSAACLSSNRGNVVCIRFLVSVLVRLFFENRWYGMNSRTGFDVAVSLQRQFPGKSYWGVPGVRPVYRIKRPSRETMVSSTKREALRAESLKLTSKPPRS